MIRSAVTLFLFLAAAAPAQKSFAQLTKGAAYHDGFVDLYVAKAKGKVYLGIDRLGQDFLYVDSLPYGVGSNDIGLDRGKLGSTRVVRFQRAGNRVMLIQRNLMHRAQSDNAAERRAVEQAFASSVLWGFEIAAEQDDAILVDATRFIVRDAFGVANTLQRSEQGSYKLDATRSFVDFAKTFPYNTELQSVLTFGGNRPGRHVRAVVPSAKSVTVRQRHSFIELPDDKYVPRRFGARSGFMSVTFRDYAQPIRKPLVQRFIRRHRLTQDNTITYYLDPGAPEPIRGALLDGARWWTKAFQAAGFENGFRVEMLPADADPMDVRYNVIQWVHRSSRGWSYGSSIADPRTGEILKGHVTLGSRRVRQDYLIAQALVGADPKKCEAMALARLRQLSAHEVGHTLGLVHNFAASTNDRASVMDYPHPKIELTEKGVDLSQAYGVGVGAWDIHAIRWGYTQFDKDQEAAGLAALVAAADKAGLRFLSDRDARPAGGMHPYAHLWDNGKDAVAELRHLLTVRANALARFGPSLLNKGEPQTRLDELLTPLYLLHRYQVDAVSKLIGGVQYGIGDWRTAKPITDATQRSALRALLSTLQPDVLAIPDRVVRAIPPRTHGTRRDRELLPSRQGPAFDPYAAAETAARETLRFLLHPDRLARVDAQHALDRSRLSVRDILAAILNAAVLEKAERQVPLREAVGSVVVDELIALAADPGAAHPVRAAARHALTYIHVGSAHKNALHARVQLFLKHPERFQRPRRLEIPPGSPIGCACGHHH